MCLHSLRFDARQFDEGELILYEQQNEALWDSELSSYHLEAKIASCHCTKADTQEKWEEILQLYNQLLLINYSPEIALNRTCIVYSEWI